jgi:S1-C subfamily serine protease
MTAYGVESTQGNGDSPSAPPPNSARTNGQSPPLDQGGALVSGTSRRQVLGILGLIVLASGGGVVGGSLATASLWRLQPATHQGPLDAPQGIQPAIAQLPGQSGQLASLYRNVAPGVVAIQVTGTGRAGSGSQGSGFIADDQGHVITNYHVVRGATRISVRLLDGTRVSAEVVVTDPANDLAVLRAAIPDGKKTAVPLGDSDSVVPGEPAIAIGNPFGLEHSITAGIVSAVDRSYGRTSSGPIRGLIQTDAPVNPGNSGGPLLNAGGEVIGINSMGASPVSGNVGVAFAIPVNAAKRLLAQVDG